jgi:hypothetical protein
MAYAVVTLATAVAVTVLAGCQKPEPPTVSGTAASSASATSSSSSASSQPTSEAATSSPPPPKSTRPPTQPSTRPPAHLAKAKRIYWEDLRAGMCIRNPSSASAKFITVVDCKATHDDEVTLRALLTGTRKWPGDDAVDASAQAKCQAAFASYVGVPFEQSRLETDYATTDRAGWSAGDHRLICLVYDPDDSSLTRSLRGSHL